VLCSYACEALGAARAEAPEAAGIRDAPSRSASRFSWLSLLRTSYTLGRTGLNYVLACHALLMRLKINKNNRQKHIGISKKVFDIYFF